jgi:hypothetical protein
VSHDRAIVRVVSVWWIVVTVLASAVVGLAVASFRRETASVATLDARAGDYLAGAFALAAAALVIFLSKLA